jgi:cbb3-type cytochrome oxidase subunit 3
MISNWLTDQGYLLGPAVALLLFLLIFAIVLVWIFRPGSTEAYEREAMLPLDDIAPGDASNISKMREDKDGGVA